LHHTFRNAFGPIAISNKVINNVRVYLSLEIKFAVICLASRKRAKTTSFLSIPSKPNAQKNNKNF
tara:strand:+ start:37 stop:231 length:195 start_codon:yes stop_codon:yes gene_type:complete